MIGFWPIFAAFCLGAALTGLLMLAAYIVVK